MTRVEQITKKRKKKVLMFRNSFKLYLFSEMFRNLLSVTSILFPEYKKKNRGSVTFVLKKKNRPKNLCQLTSLISVCRFWAGRSSFMKFCVGMRKELIFPFFMSSTCNKELMKSLNELKFVFDNSELKFPLDINYFEAKSVLCKRLYNLFFIISFCSKSTAQKVRVGRRIFSIISIRIWNKTKNCVISLVVKKKIAGIALNMVC